MRTIIGLAAPARSGKDTVAAILLNNPGVAAYALADPLKMGCQVLWGLTDEQAWSDALKEQTIPLWGRSPRELFQQVGTEWMREFNADHWLKRAELAINPPIESSEPANITTLESIDAPFRLAAQAFFGFTSAQVWDEQCSIQLDAYWGVRPQEIVELLSRKAHLLYPGYSSKRATLPTVAPRPLAPLPAHVHTIIIKDIRFENEASYLRSHNGKIWHIKRPNSQLVNPHSSESGIAQQPGDTTIMNDSTLQALANRVADAWQEIRPTH
ncbi:deoxynucleotide monophosphate kinase [Pseudomonas sp. 250J]|uniref:Deoxynucleotide monophosphate kinase n=1 Tax=Pseudomonas peradeniyensis TaxID=2745488 RepID=A0ABT2VI23_9PSED|nr:MULTISPECIES: deoxynucleotide monophosphate kinase [unclassified Pseudomonas]KNX78937.1 deoxynucleotide monophosphate kinase [Pseudomonas sp. 250J]MCU7240955.1 deoxynucleotide monophosphate kinase [Pseudomonas peradeniyensis]MCU7282816.1 deoxynucleotide monophosphate kinase [Pseudomonas peradeniyensis]